MRSLKILYSAYACEPGKGSEPGIGWRWALETARLGHRVWVITRENNRAGIAQGIAAADASANLHFVHYDLPRWARWWKRGGRGVHLYYVLWQWGAWRLARRLHARQRFDAVHHITFGVMRHPSFMDRLGIPCVIGPLGGGERAPLALRRHYPPLEYLREAARDAANVLARLDPWVRRMLARATLILAKTPETLQWIDAKYRAKASCMLEIGVDSAGEAADATAPSAGKVEDRAPPPRAAALRLVYVGRFISVKGMALGLRAVARLLERGVPVELAMIGQGPELQRWQALGRDLGISHAITWIPWMRQADLLRTYGEFDALLFPSLHDSSGNVVLEAMAAGLPVICLDLGGPAQIVDAGCGMVVAVHGQDEAGVIAGLAEAMGKLAGDARLAQTLRAGARARARGFAWARVVSRIWGADGSAYRLIAGAPGRQAVAGPPP